MGGSEKNRGAVITSLQFAFRRRDRNLTPFKNMPDTFSIDFAFLQISSFEKAILYTLWDIPPGKIGKHAQVKHFPNPSARA